MPGPPVRSKVEVARTLLAASSMFIHLDPRRQGVRVPQRFAGQAQLVLQVGYDMAIPIPDLRVDEAGLSATLSFNHTPFRCLLPWSAIYALIDEQGRGAVWDEDVPPEVRAQGKVTKEAPGPPAQDGPIVRPREQAASGPGGAPNDDLSCSFCGKSRREVKMLIAGPTAYICDECVELCRQIIAESQAGS